MDNLLYFAEKTVQALSRVELDDEGAMKAAQAIFEVEKPSHLQLALAWRQREVAAAREVVLETLSRVPCLKNKPPELLADFVSPGLVGLARWYLIASAAKRDAVLRRGHIASRAQVELSRRYLCAEAAKRDCILQYGRDPDEEELNDAKKDILEAGSHGTAELQALLVDGFDVELRAPPAPNEEDLKKAKKELEKDLFDSDDETARLFLDDTKAEVMVTVERAENLLNADNGKLHKSKDSGEMVPNVSDPYCKVKMGGLKHFTKTVQDNLNPVWNETFLFPLRKSLNHNTCIEFKVYDKDKYSKPTKIGYAKRTLGELQNMINSNEVSHRLDLAPQGHLFVRLDYLGPPVAKLSLQKGTSMLNLLQHKKRKQIPVFGSRIEDVVDQEDSGLDIPRFVRHAINFLREKALDIEGIFRVPGSEKRVQELKAAVNEHPETNFTATEDPLNVASLLKAYMRELPEPLFGYDNYEAVIAFGDKDEEEQTLEDMEEVLKKLTPISASALLHVLGLLREVADQEEITKMGPKNLAIVFGPSLLRPKSEDLESLLSNAKASQKAIRFLIAHFNDLKKVLATVSLRDKEVGIGVKGARGSLKDVFGKYSNDAASIRQQWRTFREPRRTKVLTEEELEKGNTIM